MYNSDDDNEDYDVGYKKPPKDKQFKKGQSGNPKGRPPKKLIYEVLEAKLNEMVTITTKDGKKVTMTMKEAWIQQLVQSSASGKSAATKNLIYLMRSFYHMFPQM